VSTLEGRLHIYHILTESVRFVSISPLYVPASSGTRDNVYVTRSYDATSHFETVTDDVKDVWRRAMKAELELKKREELEIAD